jgi:ssRNA-specific RNase YbeY (16S rRNA maturation enzyme)
MWTNTVKLDERINLKVNQHIDGGKVYVKVENETSILSFSFKGKRAARALGDLFLSCEKLFEAEL